MSSNPEEYAYTIDPSFATAVALALESAINTALKFDPGTRQSLIPLTGKVLRIKTHQPKLELSLNVIGDQLFINAHPCGEYTTLVEGRLLELFSLIISPGPSLAKSGVTVGGQISLLANYQQILSTLDIDWEDALSSALGEVPAHQLGNRLRGLFNWLIPRVKSFPSFLSEFLTEELRAIPASTELEQFTVNVTTLRQDADRLEARLQKLQLQASAIQPVLPSTQSPHKH